MQLLETETTKYRISLDGYNKKTPIILKYIADFVIIILMPAGEAILAHLQTLHPTPWTMFWWATGCAIFKLITKFISEFPKVQPDEEVS